ncbi:MAG: LacI family DNA-binding transcriptional regulator [Bryobacterales bacterium]|nr:LacI family DNA-binding transcriptional regulator [Bryobacterales bacterium]
MRKARPIAEEAISGGITIKDVAQEAGVSVATVSKALRGADRVSEETRKRIVLVAERMGWRANNAARSLVTKRSYLLGLVTASITNNFSAQVYEGADSYASEKGYGILLCVTEDDYRKERQALERLRLEVRADGAIAVPAPAPAGKSIFFEPALAAWPYVFVTRHFSGLASDRVLCDDAKGGAMLTRHLIQLGHRRIAFIFDSLHTGCSHVLGRRQGYLSALAEAGIKPDPDLMIALDVDAPAELSRALMSQLESLGITAVFGHVDRTAVRVMQLARAAGIDVPARLSIVGFGNLNISELVSPPLTTADYAPREMGRLAARILIERLERPSAARHQIVMEPHLVDRASTARVRK